MPIPIPVVAFGAALGLVALDGRKRRRRRRRGGRGPAQRRRGGRRARRRGGEEAPSGPTPACTQANVDALRGQINTLHMIYMAKTGAAFPSTDAEHLAFSQAFTTWLPTQLSEGHIAPGGQLEAAAKLMVRCGGGAGAEDATSEDEGPEDEDSEEDAPPRRRRRRRRRQSRRQRRQRRRRNRQNRGADKEKLGALTTCVRY